MNNPLIDVKSNLQKIKRIMQDSTVEASLHYLQGQVSIVDDAIQFKSVGIDLIYDDGIGEIEEFKSWIDSTGQLFDGDELNTEGFKSKSSSGVDLNFYRQDFSSIQPGKVGSFKSPILIVCLDFTSHDESELLFKLKKQSDGRAMILLMHSKEAAADWRQVKTELGKSVLKVESMDLSKLDSESFDAWVSSDSISKVLNGLQAYSVAKSLSTMSEVIKLSIEQQGRELGGMKLVTQQDANRVKSASGNSRESMELMSSLKSLLQDSISGYQKGLKRRFEDLYKTNVGSLWKEMEEWSESLDELSIEERTKKVVVTVPDDFTEEYLNHVHNVIHQSLTTDLIALKDTLHQIQNDVERKLSKSGIKSTSIHFSYVTEAAVTRLLQSSIRIDRPYQGEGQKKGPMEYFMAIRRYQMVFFMLLSTFGGAATMLKKRLEILLPVTLVLLSAGGYFVVTGVKKEREDQKTKDLEKARESLKTEYKRMFSEVQRDWFSIMDEHVKEQLSKALNQLEEIVKSHFENKAKKLDKEKDSIQRKSKSIDGKESKLVNLKKNIDSTSTELKKFQMELRRSVNESMRASKLAAK